MFKHRGSRLRTAEMGEFVSDKTVLLTIDREAGELKGTLDISIKVGTATRQRTEERRFVNAEELMDWAEAIAAQEGAPRLVVKDRAGLRSGNR